MSYNLVNIFPSLPRTSRGTPIVLGNDPKNKNFLYVNGNTVYIRNIENLFDCDVYTEHSAQVCCAKYSPSGFYIASGDQTGKVRIWDTTNKEHILKNEYQPISGAIKDLQWTADSQRMIVGGEGRDKFGHVFMIDTGASVGEICGMSKAINSVDFKSSRPFRAVTASEDSCICYFEGPPFKFKGTRNEHDKFVNIIRYSPNGDKFASGGADGRLVIFDGKDSNKITENKNAHNGSVFSLCWDPTSQRVCTVGGDKAARIWNIDGDSITLVKEFIFGNNVDDQQVGCLWQGPHLITVSLCGFINYLNLNCTSPDNQLLKVVKGHSKSITALEVANFNGQQRIFSASHDGLIFAWDPNNGDAVSLNGNSHKNLVQSIVFNKNDSLTTCSLDDTVKFIDLLSMEYNAEIKMDSQPQQLVYASENVVVVACVKELVSIKDKKLFSSFKINYEASCISARPNSSQIAVGGRDNKVHIYNFDANNGSFNEIKVIDERDFLTAVKYSNNGVYLAVVDNTKNIKCYTVDNNYENITRELWQHHAARVTALAWSPDSKLLASCAIDTHSMIYSPEAVKKNIHIKNAHPLNPLSCCTWLDNSNLITGSQDCCLRRWKINF